MNNSTYTDLNNKSQASQASPRAHTERNALIRQLYAEGETMPDIAARFGITKQRVFAILWGNRKPSPRGPLYRRCGARSPKRKEDQ